MMEAALAAIDQDIEAAAERDAMTEKRIAIGIVMPLGSQQGGAEALLQYLLRQARPEYQYVCAFLEDGPLVDEARDLGYDTTVFPITHLSHLGNYFATVRALRSWIKAKRLRLVVSWMHKAHMYVSLAALFLPTRTVWFQHGIPHGILDRLVTMLPAKAVLCCSRTSKQGQDQILPRRQSHICYPGIALSPDKALDQEQAREYLGLPKTSPIVGMVARLEEWKGAHIFVESADAILGRYPDATLFIVGGQHPLDKPYSERIDSMVRNLNRGKQFLLAGQRPMTEVPLWQAAADVIVHPVVGVEPFGMSVVEAMAQGKVVIASDVGGPAEVIQNGVNGILIPARNPRLLASAVTQLLGDPERRIAIEQQAFLRAQAFSVDAFASRFNHLMAQFLLS